MFSIFNIKKKCNNNSKQNEEQNQTCKTYNEDGEPNDKSSNNIFNSSLRNNQLQNYHRNRRNNHLHQCHLIQIY